MFTGCNVMNPGHDNEAESEEVPAIAITQWTNDMELFMEWETAVIGNPIKFIVHLTTLMDFQPVREGKVILEFTDASGQTTRVEKNELLREGIFLPFMTFDKVGEYEFKLSYYGEKVNDSFEIEGFHVYSAIGDIPEAEEESEDEIGFLKEQQWKIKFATETAIKSQILSSVHAVGEVQADPGTQAIIVSPARGIFTMAANQSMVQTGQRVKKGQILGVLTPPVDTQQSWAEVYLNYEQAKSDYESAKRLNARGALSDQEFNRIRRNYEIHSAGISSLNTDPSKSVIYDTELHHFNLISPLEGIVSRVSAVPGQQIDAGTELISIVDPVNVLLSLDLQPSQAASLQDPSGISIRIPGIKDDLNIPQNDLKLISNGEFINPSSGTVQMLLAVENSTGNLKIGQRFSAVIYTTPTEQHLTVPRSAVYDENGQKVVFIHTSGEGFVKQSVTTGPIYMDKIAILDGLTTGKRVVTVGGYQVKLASTTEEIGHPHAH